MRRRWRYGSGWAGLLVTCQFLAWAQNYPSARISNGQIEARLLLPDAKAGSYRGTRFDWSGIISSLTWKGHEYFGRWYGAHDPLVHDAITGPVDIFDTDGAGLGYAEAAPGQGFVRIGVGVVEKPEERAYRGTYTYKITDSGRWRVRRHSDSIQFDHELAGPAGYAYAYSKTVRLTPGKPQMVLSHTLRNTGTKAIDTTVFNHGFFQLDGEPAGPGLIWTFPWSPRPAGELGGIATVNGPQITYSRELRDGERVLAVLSGYGTSPADHGFSVENRKTGVAVRVTGDRPIMKMNFWSRRMAYSPEIYIHLSVPPGGSETWETKYDFYFTWGQE